MDEIIKAQLDGKERKMSDFYFSYEEDYEPEEEYTYDDYLEDRADEEYHRMKDEGEI